VFAFEFKKYFRKKYFPCDKCEQAGEIIWPVFVAVSVAYLLWICLASNATFLIATLVSLTLASSDAA